jgi:hypothetical protein
MNRRGLLLGAAVALWAGTARADLPVIDVGGHLISLQSLAQAIKSVAAEEQIIANQVTQIIHLKATVEAVMHGDVLALAELGPELSGLGLGDLVDVGAGGAAVMDSLSGVAFATGRLSGLTSQLLSKDAMYLPTATDWSAGRMVSQARAFAAQKALATSSFDASTKQIRELEAVRAKAARAGDVTAAAQATASISAITAKAQMEGNQLTAAQIMQRAQAGTAEAQEQQMSRCAFERLAANAAAAQQAAAAGQIQFVTNVNVPCTAAASAQIAETTGGATLTVASYSTVAPVEGGTALDTMLAQPWGQTAADNATALGVSPTALAATCVMESNCRANVGGTGTISGAFQMSNGTYAETVSAVQASNPDLAAQITAKNDPASQSIAAAQYLRQGATTLQGSGIANPTTLDVRGYYQFGPGNAASLAAAPDDQLMAGTLTGLSSRTLAANNITADTTVGQWRQSVEAKLGSAASQPVLLGRSRV